MKKPIVIKDYMNYVFDSITGNVFELLKEKKYMFIDEIIDSSGAGMTLSADLRGLAAGGIKSDR